MWCISRQEDLCGDNVYSPQDGRAEHPTLLWKSLRRSTTLFRAIRSRSLESMVPTSDFERHRVASTFKGSASSRMCVCYISLSSASKINSHAARCSTERAAKLRNRSSRVWDAPRPEVSWSSSLWSTRTYPCARRSCKWAPCGRPANTDSVRPTPEVDACRRNGRVRDLRPSMLDRAIMSCLHGEMRASHSGERRCAELGLCARSVRLHGANVSIQDLTARNLQLGY